MTGDRPAWPWIAAATAVGAAARFVDLDAAPLWLDENATFLCIQTLVARTADAPHFIQATNLLYYAALWLWTQAAGMDVAALRSFSALAGTACIPAMGSFATRLAGARCGWAAAWLTALHPLHVYYSREARSYAFWTLLLLLAIAALWRATQRTADPQRATTGAPHRDWSWALAGAAWLAAFGAHAFTLYALPASAAAIAWAPRDSRRRVALAWARFAGSVALIIAAYAAVAIVPLLELGAGAWVAGSWESASALLASLWALLPSGAYPFILHGLSLDSERTVTWAPPVLALLAAAIPVAICLGVVLAAMRHDRDDPAQEPAGDPLPLAALALIPLGLQWLQSALASPVYLVGRYDLVAWPGLMLWIAVAITRVSEQRRALSRVLVIGLCACALVPLVRLHLYDGGERWHLRRAEALAARAGPGDLVIVFGSDADELAHALYQRGFAARLRSFPSWVDRQIAWVDSAADLAPERTRALAEDAHVLQDEVRATIESGARVLWLDDSLARSRRGPRAVIAERLEAVLRANGFERAPLEAGPGEGGATRDVGRGSSDELGIHRLQPRSPTPRP